MKFTSQKMPLFNPYIEIEIYTAVDFEKTIVILLDKWYFEVQLFLNEENYHPIEFARFKFETLGEASSFFKSFSNGSKKLQFIMNKHLISHHPLVVYQNIQ